MAFKFTVKQNPVSIEFDVGSVAEGLAILTEENIIAKMAAAGFGDAAPQAGTDTADAATAGKRNKRNKNQPDPATATAPAPAPVPNSAPPPPAPMPPSAPAPAPAPPAPPPPPAAPTAPPAASVFRDKVIAELKTRADASPDKGAALAKWLADCGAIVKDANFKEALSVIQFLDDAKLSPIAAALGVAA